MELGRSLVALGGAFLAAGLLTRAGRRIGLPTIPVIMAAGVLLGPHTPGLVLFDDPAELKVLATRSAPAPTPATGTPHDDNGDGEGTGKVDDPVPADGRPRREPVVRHRDPPRPSHAPAVPPPLHGRRRAGRPCAADRGRTADQTASSPLTAALRCSGGGRTRR